MSQKNIYQKFIEVQKSVTTVQKNDSVQVTQNSSYKAVSHDDVAALLHTPLADAGIVMLPTVTDYQTSVYEVEKQGYGSKPNYIQRQYRTDLQIKVEWINAEKPEDRFESVGGSFAIDSGDKGYAKAYSLALKIVLLKCHLLESRDGEESRDNEKDIVHSKQSAPPQKKYEKVDPSDYVMTMGSDAVKGKKLGTLSLDQLNAIDDHLSNQVKTAKITDKQKKFYGFVLSQVRTVQASKEPQDKPPLPDAEPESLGMDDFEPPLESTNKVIERLKKEHGGAE